MLTLKIYSREEIEQLSIEPFQPNTALISITDYDWPFAELKHSPEYLLQLAFDDIDSDIFEDEHCTNIVEKEKVEEKYHMLSNQQAQKIASFYYEIKDKAGLLICQCEHGQSRSAAVAAAILEHQQHSGIDIFASDAYYPNKLIFRKVLSALRCTN